MYAMYNRIKQLFVISFYLFIEIFLFNKENIYFNFCSLYKQVGTSNLGNVNTIKMIPFIGRPSSGFRHKFNFAIPHFSVRNRD